MNNDFVEIIAVYSISVILFCVTFFYIKVAPTVRKVLEIGQKAVSTIMNSSIDDRAKEIAIQKAAIEMTKNFAMITLKCFVIAVLTTIPIIAAHIVYAFPIKEMVEFSLRGDTILITCGLVAFCIFVIRRCRMKKSEGVEQGGFSEQYSIIDRTVHRIAFRSGVLQEMLGDIESMIFRKQWADVPIRQPVFISSLPRAGTTILLEAFHHLSGFAAHTYRDMPFILSPVLWSKFSLRIRVDSNHLERAHGDGVIVSEDSPEAFEEVIWRKIGPEYFEKDGHKLWRDDVSHKDGYLKEHIKKIIYLRCLGTVESARYVSKNNANIARIDAIRNSFADSTIIVPFRNPVEQAISLWRQHLNFLKQHSADSFVKEYMGDIGHYEFGLLHRPIRFPLYEELSISYDPKQVDYWLAYWVSAFDYLSEKEGLSFISYEALCKSPHKGLSTIMEYINFAPDRMDLERAAAIFRRPSASRGNDNAIDRALVARSDDIYRELKNRCILSGTF